MLLDHVPSVQIGRFGGIPIRVDLTFLLVPIALLTAIQWSALSTLAVGTGLVVAVGVVALKVAGVFCSILLHELGHCVVAHRFGMPTREIRIGGFYGLAIMAAHWRSRRAAIWILLAGPFANLLVVIWLWLLLGAPVVSATLALGKPVLVTSVQAVPELVYVLRWLLFLNVAMLVFNLLPAFPLDGGRVGRLLLERRFGVARAIKTVAGLGLIVGLWSIMGAPRYGVTLGFIGLTLLVFNFKIWAGSMPAPDD